MIFSLIRKCYAKLWNRQFLIFLFFFALSFVFWVFQTLNETYEEDFIVPLELSGVPKNVVITTDLPAGLHVTLRDKGITLLTYRYTNRLSPVVIDFNQYSGAGSRVSIPGSDLMRSVLKQLQPGTQLTAFKPDVLEFYYNYGECKKVPVKISEMPQAGRLFTIAKTLLSQDSVTVYATREALDTITAAYTRRFALHQLTDTTSAEVGFICPRGAKFVPASVKLTFCVDRMVEKTVQVPVQQVNFPASKQLRTFPAKVNLTFQVGMSQYKHISADNFVLVVNYEDLLKSKGNTTRLSLKTIPTGVTHVRIRPQDVEFVIEDIPGYDSEDETE